MGLAPTLLGHNNIRLTNKFFNLNYKFNQLQHLLNRYKAISCQSAPILPTTKNHNNFNRNIRNPLNNSRSYNLTGPRSGILKKPRSSSKHLTQFQANSNHSNLHKLRQTLPSTSSTMISSGFSTEHRMLMSQQSQQHMQQHSQKIIMKNRLKFMKKSQPIISNMPFINFNSSLILVNTSPFALSDPRFGILHHDSPSLPYL